MLINVVFYTCQNRKHLVINRLKCQRCILKNFKPSPYVDRIKTPEKNKWLLVMQMINPVGKFDWNMVEMTSKPDIGFTLMVGWKWKFVNPTSGSDVDPKS